MDEFSDEFEEAAIKFDKDKLDRFMKQPQPYDVCRYILEKTRDSRVIYFVGEWLSRAIIQEWNSELRSDGFMRLTDDNITQTKPYKLVEFLINWVFNRDYEITVGAQQKILTPIAVITKLSALDEISKNSGNPETEQNELYTFLKMLMLNISDNFTPIEPRATYERERSRILSGLALFSVLINEFSKNDSAYNCLDLPLECFERMQDRFENFEWVHLFQMLIALIGRILGEPDWLAFLQKDDVLTFRLVNCLELITSIDLHKKYRKAENRDIDSHISLDSRWESALGISGISDCLSILLKFYALLRENKDYSQRIFTSIATIVSVRFKDRSDAYNVEHAAFCMSVLARSLLPLNINPFDGITANLISKQESGVYKPLKLTLDRPPPILARFSEIEVKFQPIGGTLRPSELPLIALMCGSFFSKVQDLLRLTARYFNDADTMSDDSEVLVKFSETMFYLNAAYEFLTFTKNILYACLIVEAGVLQQQAGLNQDELQDAVMSAHEASERILRQIRNTYCSDAYRCETDVPIPLTTGKMAERDYLAYQLKQAHIQTRDYFESHLRDVVRVCIASCVAPPDGFRNDGILCRFTGDSPTQDLEYFEDRLFEIGELANAFQSDFVNGVFDDLRSVLSNRADQWLQLGQATPRTVFDDIHQILLFLGHILVQGNSDFGTTRGGRYAWELDFLETCAYSVNAKHLRWDIELKEIHKYLIDSTIANICQESDFIPPFIKIFHDLFQLLAVLIKSDSSTPLLTEDMCWIFTRLVVTFFSFRRNFVVRYSHVDRLWGKMFQPTGPSEFWRLENTLVHVAISLTSSTIGILERWAGEPRLVKRAEMLLFVIARHILPFMGRTQQAIGAYLPVLVDIWQRLCSAMITAIQQTTIPLEDLIPFINACTQGAWYLRTALKRPSDGRNLFHQVHTELESLTSVSDLESNPDRYKTLFISGLGVVRGLSRALCGIMRDSTDSLFMDSQLKISTTGVKEIPAFMWQGCFANILSICVGPLSPEICSSPDLSPLVLSTFDEVAESVLVYLIDVPVTLTSEELSEFQQIICGMSITLPEPYTATAYFLMLTILLCHRYAMAHFDATTGSFMPLEEKRVDELLLIFSILGSILHHVSNILLRNPIMADEILMAAERMSSGGNICFVCLRLILPLMNVDHLKVPEISTAFFTLVANITYDSPESICKLFDENHTETLDQFCTLLRFGLFQDANETVTLRTLDVIEYIVQFCLKLSSTDPVKAILTEHLNLNDGLVGDLLDLVVSKYPPSTGIRDRISQCVFVLARLDKTSLAQSAVVFVEKCGPNARYREKLEKNFNDLYRTMVELDDEFVGKSETCFKTHFSEFLSTIRSHIRLT